MNNGHVTSNYFKHRQNLKTTHSMDLYGFCGRQALSDPVKANDCVWELPKNELLAQCLAQKVVT